LKYLVFFGFSFAAHVSAHGAFKSLIAPPKHFIPITDLLGGELVLI
jgi:hypothetical protein